MEENNQKQNKKSWLEQMREKSDAEKRSFAFFVSFLITLLVAGVWATSVVYNFKKIEFSEQTANVSSAQGPIMGLINNFKQVFNSIK